MAVTYKHVKTPGLPLLGRALEFGMRRLAFVESLGVEGDTVDFRLGRYRTLAISHPELVHQVLVDQAASFNKAPGLSTFGRVLLGDGLLSAEGETHRRHRKLLAPAFSPKRVAMYGRAMVSQTRALTAHWQPGRRVDLDEEMMRITLAIVGQTLFSTDLREDAPVVHDALTKALKYIMRSAAIPIDHELPRLGTARYKRNVARIEAIVYRIIAEAQAAGGDRGDVLSMLFAARDDEGQGLSNREIRDEVITLLLAGHETTANTLAWTWHLLAKNREWMSRARQELKEVVGDAELTVEHLPQLPLGRAILLEAMRLFPPAFVIAREPNRTVQIDSVTIHPGEFIIIPVFGIHRRPELFSNPQAFDPTRFLGEKLDTRRHGYLPFGAGPRVCIGNHFAMMEAQLMFSTILGAWDLDIESLPSVGEAFVTLRPKHGVPAYVRGKLG